MASILVIEDNEANRELLQFLLSSSGHDVILACDGTTGLDMIRSQPCDLVLMDIFMPGMDGFELIHRVRNDPVLGDRRLYVAVTALAMQGDREKLIDAGFDGYISKPIDAADFLGYIGQLLNESAS